MSKACAVCGRDFEARRSTARYCGATCRQRSRRSPGARPASVSELSDAQGLYEEARRELEEAQALGSVLGQLTLQLARRVAAAGPAESGFATLVKEFRATRAEVLRGSEPVKDPVDQVRERRERKARQAAASG